MADTSDKNIFMSSNPEIIRECLTKQLSELELFQAMYTPREIIITNPNVLDDIRKFVDEKTDYSPNDLDYSLHHCMDNIKVEISIHLPSMYPIHPPDINVRCNELNRHQETTLNSEITAYIQSKHDGEVSIFTAIMWLQDNIGNFVSKAPTKDPQSNIRNQHNFSRYWIYSHHIYSKKKMEEMTKLSKELSLCGFCLMGKPGVICIEGNEEDCKLWWRTIKTMNWQKIALRITENFNNKERIKQQKFNSFDIISLPTAMGRGHSDLGSFQKYMERIGLVAQVTEFFGMQST